MRLRSCAVLVGLLTAAVLVAAPAQAGRQTTKDAAHDVYKQANGSLTLAPANRNHDIVRAGTVHRGRTVKLWLEVRRLPDAGYVATWDVKTPNRRWALHRDTRGGIVYTSLFHFHGPEVLDCGGLRSRALPRQDRVELTVPRACVGNPRWIRFGASMGRETPRVIYIDDARLDAGFRTGSCELGPRVRHN